MNERDAQDTKTGERLAELLGLRKDRETGRYQTSGGDKTAMDSGDEHGAGSEWHTKARAAIAKATGVTQ